MTWQYNGIAPFEKILNWCEHTIPGQFTYAGWETIDFLKDSAYTMFILKWS